MKFIAQIRRGSTEYFRMIALPNKFHVVEGVNFFKHRSELFSDELSAEQVKSLKKVPYVTLSVTRTLPELPTEPKLEPESKPDPEPEPEITEESKSGEGHWEQVIPTANPRPFVPASNKKKDDVSLDSLGMPIKRRSEKEKFRTRIAPSSLKDE